MKIAIIGKGASMLGVITAINQAMIKHLKIDIFHNDIHFDINDKNATEKEVNEFYKKNAKIKIVPPKINIKKNIIDNSKIFEENYEAMSLWGTSFLPFSDIDLKKNGLPKEKIQMAYDEISKVVPISSDKQDFLENLYKNTYINQPPLELDLNVSNMINNLNGQSKNYRFVSGQSRLALYNNENQKNSTKCECIINNCKEHKLFLSNEIFEYLNKSKINFQLINREVKRVNFKEKKIFFNDVGRLYKNQYDLIFICTGAKKTLNLLHNSLGKNNDYMISDNRSFIFPIINWNFFNLFKRIKNFSLTNSVSVIQEKNSQNEKYFLQIYSTSKHTWKSVVPKFLWSISDILSPILSRIIYMGVLYLDDNDKVDYKINFKDDKIYYEKISKALNKKVKSIIKEINKKIGVFNIILNFLYIENKSSHHFGNIRINSVSMIDEVKKYEAHGIYFCGSSIFKALPSTSPTFTIMAQSNIIAREAIRNIN